MSFSNINDNDDDLFSDQPSSTKRSTDSIIDDIQSLIEKTSTADLEKIDSMIFRSKVAISLFDGSNSFIFGTTSYNRTIFNTLNYLTDNKFQYDLFADVLEESISRRIIILDFINVMISESDKELLNKFSQILNVQIDNKFIITYFGSMRKLLSYAIAKNTSLYISICEKLERQPLSHIISGQMDDDLNHLLSSDSYINNVFTNIKKSFGHGTF